MNKLPKLPPQIIDGTIEILAMRYAITTLATIRQQEIEQKTHELFIQLMNCGISHRALMRIIAAADNSVCSCKDAALGI